MQTKRTVTFSTTKRELFENFKEAFTHVCVSYRDVPVKCPTVMIPTWSFFLWSWIFYRTWKLCTSIRQRILLQKISGLGCWSNESNPCVFVNGFCVYSRKSRSNIIAFKPWYCFNAFWMKKWNYEKGEQSHCSQVLTVLYYKWFISMEVWCTAYISSIYPLTNSHQFVSLEEWSYSGSVIFMPGLEI